MASLKDIAESTGVSVRTVSRALKDSGYVAADVRRRVLAEADRLGYRPNLAARSLRTGEGYEIGVLIDSTDELHIAKLAAMEDACRQAGYSLHVTFAGGASADRDALQTLLRLRPAGVVLFPSVGDIGEAAVRLDDAAIPYMAIDVDEAGVDAVGIDRQQGVYEAVRYLAECGRRRIAYLGPESGGRVGGYDRAIAELELPRLAVLTGAMRGGQMQAGRDAVEQLLREQPDVDAIQVYSDVMAAGVLHGLHARGVRVPRQIAVVGFDDRASAALAWPPLTTVAQPNRLVGQAVAERLLAKIRKDDSPPGGWSCRLPTQLVVREST